MLIITLIILSTLACAGLSNDTTKTFNVESSVFPYTVTDARGNAVTFQTSPRRIVAMDSAVVETLFAIGEGDRVVGVHDFVSYPPATDGLPRVGDAYNINIEAVVSLEPDLVCVFSGQVIEDLQRAGLTVLYLESLQDDFRKTSDNSCSYRSRFGSYNTRRNCCKYNFRDHNGPKGWVRKIHANELSRISENHRKICCESMDNIAVILLAAGQSKRMGTPKSLLPWRGRPLIDYQISVLTQLELKPVVVVLGHNSLEVKSNISLRLNPTIVYNPHYKSGKTSSILEGLRFLNVFKIAPKNL